MSENDFSGKYNQSGVIPYRINNDHVELLMITSAKKKKWIFPKGIIESHFSAADSAAKEAFEEAGVKGKIFPEMLGTYTYKKWAGLCQVQLYLMEVQEIFKDWPEADFRKRKWVSLKQAIKLAPTNEVAGIISRLSISQIIKNVS